MNEPLDMMKTIVPKSDQLNADDLLGISRTVTITGVRGNESAEQPISIHFEGDDGKPYKPCKSMRRVMVHIWGADANKYAGRSMTLYCDPEVQFGGMKVGGIRISHMSGIDKPQTMALTATRAKRKPFTVQPLTTVPQQQKDPEVTPADKAAYLKLLQNAANMASLQATFRDAWRWAEKDGDNESRDEIKKKYDECKQRFS
jgi:hypothetical protein